MQGEEGRDQGAAPQRAGHSLQREEEEQGVGGVEAEVRQMVSTGAQAEDFNVQHVGKPGQGMPVAAGTGAKSPQDILCYETARDVCVRRYVIRVVERDEGVVKHRPE